MGFNSAFKGDHEPFTDTGGSGLVYSFTHKTLGLKGEKKFSSNKLELLGFVGLGVIVLAPGT